MRRIPLLILAVLMLAAQKGDSLPSARASVCLNAECSRTGTVGSAPATVQVSFYIPRHADNRSAAFGLQCEAYERHSGWTLDGEKEASPAWIVRYRDVPAGRCIAALVVRKADGSDVHAKSGEILIQ
jgi:hypothetical protein